MSDYRVNIDIFAGPLDLLLYLVRREEVDIYDIPIAKITDQYLHHIEMLKSLDVDLAGDFLVMAATLMQIKSSLLLPPSETGQPGADESTDPRAELIRQLLEYKQFKDAANLLSIAAEEQSERFPRPETIIKELKPLGEPEVDLEQVSVWDLLEAFDTVCKAVGVNFDISYIKDETPIDLYQIEILHRLQTEGPRSFAQIFEGKANRIVMIGLFLAILELIRDRLVWAEQADTSGTIFLRSLTDEPAEQAVRKTLIAATAETNNEQKPQVQQPPIAIVELPPKNDSGVCLNETDKKGLTGNPQQQISV